MLEISRLDVYYGVIRALHEISLRVGKGEIVTLIGANGAGKSTTLLTLSGLLTPLSGSIIYEGSDITYAPAHRRVEMGIVQVPEGRRVFANMSVSENLELGAYTRKDKAGVRQDLERVFALFPILAERRKQAAGTLSGGQQQMLAIGRALMGRPRLLLMDEPSLGLAPLLVKEIFQTIAEIRSQGVTVLLVEQNAHMALSLADRAYVLETGRITLSGPAKELLANEEVKKAYLGG
jgi:branched-chain amino acid transport system ATP-binding protein